MCSEECPQGSKGYLIQNEIDALKRRVTYFKIYFNQMDDLIWSIEIGIRN